MACIYCHRLPQPTLKYHLFQCPQINVVRVDRYPNMAEPSLRSLSFKKWPKANHISEFVDAGFFFTKKADIVTCFCCLLSLGNWTPGDHAVERHFNASPGCSYLLHRFNNFSVCDTCNAIVIGDLSEHASRAHVPRLHADLHRSMHTEIARRKTFATWPLRRPKASAFHHTGLYYTGSDNHVVCFFCNIWLSDWTLFEDPVQRHYQTFPTCAKAVWAYELTVALQAVNYDAMREEATRLDTFDAVPGRPLPGEELAQLGFFYVQYDDVIQCVFCRLIVRRCLHVSSYLKKHVRWSPKCPFLLGKETGNVPIEWQGPRHPHMQQAMKRLRTFHRWSDRELSPFDLVRQGFYFNSQCGVQCYWCGFRTQNYSEFETLHAREAECWLAHKPRPLPDKATCKICLNNEVQIVCKPCQHLVCCSFCATSLGTCPVCRQEIETKERIYLS